LTVRPVPSSKNQKWVASFDGIAHLQIRTTEGEYSTEHTLTAVLHMGEKIEIDDSKGDASDIVALADDIADILGVKVVRKFDPFNSLWYARQSQKSGGS
jgi:hypothetical protein